MELKVVPCVIDVLIIANMFIPMVHSLPFLDEIKSRTSNNDLIKLLIENNARVLGFSQENLINVQNTEGFGRLQEISEQRIQAIYDGLKHLFFKYNHPAIQDTKNESEIFREDCQAPKNVFEKRKGSNFCTICEEDLSAATDLIEFFQEAESAEELLDMGEKCKPFLNEYLFNYALTYLLITKFPDIDAPLVFEQFPVLFIKKDQLDNISREKVEKRRRKRNNYPIVVHVSPTFNSLAHFCEDYGYNSNHWNWHIIHRANSRIDRRGELFWYMHHQMLARYDIERLSLGLNRVESSGPLNRTLKYGFNPNLKASSNGEEWASRPDNTNPRSIRRNGRVAHDINDLILWHTRLAEAARNGFMLDENNQSIELSDDTDVNNNETRGIDIFTAATEADRVLTPNMDYYGFLHNNGHRIVARLHDLESRGSSLGVMASAAVSGRDPAFYEWHKFIEEVIQVYKTTQPPYSHQRLEFANIFLRDVRIALDSERLSIYKQHVNSEFADSKILEDASRNITGNELLTGCNTYGVDISRGVDFQDQVNDVILEITHLDHIPFNYNISVKNDLSVNKSSTVRIFLAPIFNSRGQRMEITEQQHLFIILDKFRYTLQPGENVILRSSSESSITSNCRTTRRDTQRESFSSSGVFGGGHCGCGWPHHLLLPRGTHDGMMFKIFVILTDGDQDTVLSATDVKEFCATSGEKYPDWQPMGYPFDRPFHHDIQYVDQLADFLTNAYVFDVSIRFTGRNILTDEFC